LKPNSSIRSRTWSTSCLVACGRIEIIIEKPFPKIKNPLR
jgi:hypothetical protein